MNLYGYANNSPVSYIDKDGRLILGPNTVIGGVLGAVVGGIGAALTGGDIVAGISSGAVSGLLLGSGVPPQIAGAVGGAIGGFVSAYNSAKDYPNICDSEIGFTVHYASRIGIGAAFGYFGGEIGEKVSDAILGVLSAQESLVILGSYAIKTEDIIIQATVDISISATEVYFIRQPEAMVEELFILDPVIRENRYEINYMYEETPGKCLCNE